MFPWWDTLHGGDVPQPYLTHIGQVDATQHTSGIRKGIAAAVSVFIRIRQFACAYSIQYNDSDSFDIHVFHSCIK